MGKWGYNLYEWSYFNLLITGFWILGPPRRHHTTVCFFGGSGKGQPRLHRKKKQEKIPQNHQQHLLLPFKADPQQHRKKTQKIGG